MPIPSDFNPLGNQLYREYIQPWLTSDATVNPSHPGSFPMKITFAKVGNDITPAWKAFDGLNVPAEWKTSSWYAGNSFPEYTHCATIEFAKKVSFTEITVQNISTHRTTGYFKFTTNDDDVIAEGYVNLKGTLKCTEGIFTDVLKIWIKDGR